MVVGAVSSPERRDSTDHLVPGDGSLHERRTVCVPGNAIRPTVSAWLAELGADSPLVEDLAQAVRTGDWPAVYAVGEHLSVFVAVAA